MLSHLLVPVDFSPSSTNAFIYAARLAKAHGAQITVMHAYRIEIVEPYMAVEMQLALQQQEQVLATDYFKGLSDELPPELLEGIDVHFELVMGIASEEILYRAESLQPDLLVMGMRGSSPLSSQLLGSVTTSVIQRTHVPLLVVPDKVQYEGYSRIAYATHLEDEDLHVIDDMLPFAIENKAMLSCVHVQDSPNEQINPRLELMRRAYAQDIQEGKIEFEIVTHEDVLEGIRQYLAENHINILVMLTHSRSLVGKMLHKSYATRMARQTTTPLWIYPMKQTEK